MLQSESGAMDKQPARSHEQTKADVPLGLQPPPQSEKLPWHQRTRYRLTDANPWLRVPVTWYRHHGFRREDVFVCEYPKSGSTWLRFMLYEILTGQPAEFESVNDASRMVGYHLSAPPILPGGGRFIATHETYRSAYHKVLYVVRDVRDVALSHFRIERHMGVSSPILDDFLLRLMRGRRRHGSWHEHALSYLDSDLAKTENFLLVRYEDLRRNVEEVLVRVVSFLGAPAGREAICRAVQNNSLEAMRAKEERVHASGIEVRMRPFKSSKEEGRFVHRGEVGGWRGKLTPAQLDLVDRYAGPTLLRLGYPPSLECR